MDWTAIVIAAISGSALTKILDAVIYYRRNTAETEGSIAAMTLSVMKQTIDNTVTPLNTRIDELEKEIDNQAQTLDRLNGELVRAKLTIVILSEQMIEASIKPIIDVERLDRISNDELRDLAAGIHNRRIRRQDAKARKEADKPTEPRGVL